MAMRSPGNFEFGNPSAALIFDDTVRVMQPAGFTPFSCDAIAKITFQMMLCIARIRHPCRSISRSVCGGGTDGERGRRWASGGAFYFLQPRSLLHIYKVDLPPQASFSHIALAGLQCWCVEAAQSSRITMWSTNLAVVFGK